MNKKAKLVLAGLLSYLPGFSKRNKKFSTGGSDHPEYCYSVWLRHLVLAKQFGLPVRPKVLAELGPGDSLGTGIAALITGTDEYYALDSVRFTSAPKTCLVMLEKILELVRNRTRIPGENSPNLRPRLKSYDFPYDIFPDDYIEKCIRPERLEMISQAILNGQCGPIKFKYIAPWQGNDVLMPNSCDMIISQAVMQYVHNLDETYNSLVKWLKDGGVMSHQMSFNSHGFSDVWNGHLAFSPLVWHLANYKRPFSLSRLPYSAHISALEKAGVEIVADNKLRRDDGLLFEELDEVIQSIYNKEDAVTAGATILAVKKR